MSDEKHGSRNGLQNKLDALQGLPGEPALDKLQSWDKLYSRLHKKPARKAISWYGIAIACLVIIFSFFILVESGRTRHETGGNAINSTAVKPPETALKSIPPVPELATVKTRIPVSAIPKRKRDKLLPMQQNQAAHQIPVISADSLQTNPPVPLIAVGPSTPGNTVLLQTRKKFKVVSLNELDEPTEENLSGYSARRGLHLKWFEQPNPAAVPLRSGNSGYEMLKINLYTPN